MTSFKNNCGSCDPKNFEDQIEHLKFHNISISKKEIHKLMNINYACVYHYASILAGKDAYDKKADKFKVLINFDDVYKFYLLDLKFSYLLFKLIGKFEKTIKSIFSCKLSCDFNIKNYKDNNFIDLYNPHSFFGKNVDEYIFNKLINQKINFGSKGAPLWKVIEYLDLGDIKYLIRNAKSQNNHIAKAKIGRYVSLFDLEFVRKLRNNICHFSPLIGNFRCSEQEANKTINEQLVHIVRKYCVDPDIYNKEVEEINNFLRDNSQYKMLFVSSQNKK